MTKTMKRNFSIIACLLICFAFIYPAIADEPTNEEIPLNPYGVRSKNPYVVKRFWENGKLIDMVIVPGCPPEVYRAPAVTPPEPNVAMGTNTLTNVPAFNWCFGCSATSAAMTMGHYDNSGYLNMYAGPTNGGVMPLDNSSWPDVVISGETRHQCPLSATRNGVDGRAIRGHVDDYWIKSGSIGPDPWVGNWTEHTHGDCTADYMGTNQWKYPPTGTLYNIDGSTLFYFYADGSPLYDYTGSEPAYRDGCHGMKLFVESRGYTVATNGNFYQLIKGQGSNPNLGFTFANFKAEIDAGRPVLIQVAGHTMLGYGYNDTGTKIYIHDTWDHLGHEMTWGGTYWGMQHFGVTVLHLTASGGGTGGGVGAGGSEACFIATAAYSGESGKVRKWESERKGSPITDNPVTILRKFRDEYLLTNPMGQAFVRSYYRHSPRVADFIRDKEPLKAIVRFELKPLVWIAEKILNLDE